MFHKLVPYLARETARTTAAFLLGRPLRVGACSEGDCDCNSCHKVQGDGCTVSCYPVLIGPDCTQPCNYNFECYRYNQC